MLSKQEKLVEILRHKGIGPEGSKSLDQENLLVLEQLLTDPEVSKTTLATLLTALLTLEPNSAEAFFLENLRRDYKTILLTEFHFFFEETTFEFKRLIKKTIRKENLDEQECRKAMDYCFTQSTEEYLIACFLEAQRLKRESFIENTTFYKYFLEKRQSAKVDLPHLVELCDSYDGVKRTPNYSVFTACVLAALGINCILHGLESVAPKHGLTTYQILEAAGKKVPMTMQGSAEILQNENIGWSYLHLNSFFPELFRISEMRTEMVKRPFLATFEKLLSPIQAEKNYLISPYTHKHYKDEVVNLLNENSPVDGFIHLKGMEATSQPNPVRKSEITLSLNKKTEERFIAPEDFGLVGLKKNPSFLEVDDLIEEGVKALSGEINEASVLIKYQSSVILHCFFGYKPTLAHEKVNEVMNNGRALERWKAF